MPKVRVAWFGVFQWFFLTRTFCAMQGQEGRTIGDIDDQFAQVDVTETGVTTISIGPAKDAKGS